MTPEDEIAELKKIIEELRRQNAELKQELEKWKRGFRERKKRFSSRPEGQRRRAAKKPGRSTGHEPAFRPVPDRVDRAVDYPIPEACACGGSVADTGEVERVIEEELPKPRVEHIAHCARVGKCRACGKRVLARLPGAAPDGRPFARVVLGGRAQALALSLRFEHHVSQRSTSRLLQRWFGLSVTPGALSQVSTRRARHTRPAKAEIRVHVQQAPVVGADETGFRQSGKSGWAWLFRTPTASLFELNPSRGGAVLESALGRIDGVLVTDFYGVYTARKDVLHGYCGAHLIREAKQLAEVEPSAVTREFADKLVALYKKGEAATDFDTRESVRNTFRWMTRAARFQKHPELARLGKRIDQNFEGVVAFVGRDDIPWNNNASERDIRPLAVHRKIVGSTRSDAGNDALGHWMSVTQTLRKGGSHLADWLPDALVAWRSGAPPPTVFPTI